MRANIAQGWVPVVSTHQELAGPCQGLWRPDGIMTHHSLFLSPHTTHRVTVIPQSCAIWNLHWKKSIALRYQGLHCTPNVNRCARISRRRLALPVSSIPVTSVLFLHFRILYFPILFRFSFLLLDKRLHDLGETVSRKTRLSMGCDWLLSTQN